MKKKQKIYLKKTPSGQTILEEATRQIKRVHITQNYEEVKINAKRTCRFRRVAAQFQPAGSLKLRRFFWLLFLSNEKK